MGESLLPFCYSFRLCLSLPGVRPSVADHQDFALALPCAPRCFPSRTALRELRGNRAHERAHLAQVIHAQSYEALLDLRWQQDTLQVGGGQGPESKDWASSERICGGEVLFFLQLQAKILKNHWWPVPVMHHVSVSVS